MPTSGTASPARSRTSSADGCCGQRHSAAACRSTRRLGHPGRAPAHRCRGDRRGAGRPVPGLPARPAGPARPPHRRPAPPRRPVRRAVRRHPSGTWASRSIPCKPCPQVACALVQRKAHNCRRALCSSPPAWAPSCRAPSNCRDWTLTRAANCATVPREQPSYPQPDRPVTRPQETPTRPSHEPPTPPSHEPPTRPQTGAW